MTEPYHAVTVEPVNPTAFPDGTRKNRGTSMPCEMRARFARSDQASAWLAYGRSSRLHRLSGCRVSGLSSPPSISDVVAEFIGTALRHPGQQRLHGSSVSRIGFCPTGAQPHAQRRLGRRFCCRSKPLKRLGNLERAKGFEPSTPTLARLCSTPELRPHSGSGRGF